MQWTTLYKKEMLENWRNFKWIWFPLIMIVLAILDPISTYYLPLIIESVGGLPDGATIDIPTPLPREVIMMSLGQLSSLGVLIIVLLSMGTIAGERKSGVSELILVKPVSYKNYITSKFASLLTLVWFSLIIAMLASWYYVNLLFGEITFISLIQVIFFYGLWLTLVVSLVIFFNTLFKSPGLIAFLTIALIMIMSIITQIFGRFLLWSPNNLSKHIHESLIVNEITTDLMITSSITVVLIIILLVVSIFTFKTKELAN